MNVKESGRGLL